MTTIKNHSDTALDLAIHADRAEGVLAALADHLIDSDGDTLDFGSLKPRHVAALIDTAANELAAIRAIVKNWA